jgi:hypothetical protein
METAEADEKAAKRARVDDSTADGSAKEHHLVVPSASPPTLLKNAPAPFELLLLSEEFKAFFEARLASEKSRKSYLSKFEPVRQQAWQACQRNFLSPITSVGCISLSYSELCSPSSKASCCLGTSEVSQANSNHTQSPTSRNNWIDCPGGEVGSSL